MGSLEELWVLRAKGPLEKLWVLRAFQLVYDFVPFLLQSYLLMSNLLYI